MHTEQAYSVLLGVQGEHGLAGSYTKDFTALYISHVQLVSMWHVGDRQGMEGDDIDVSCFMS